MDIVGNKLNTQESKSTGVVLIHGLTGTPVEMKPLEKYLRKLGLEVESVTLAGHGAGHDEIVASNWTQWIDSARDGMKAMLAKYDRVILCGLSMGAVIGSILAGEEERVSALVMLSPTLRYDGSVLLNSAFDWIYHADIVTRSVAVVSREIPLVGNNLYWEELPPYGIRDERIQRQITKSIEQAKTSGSNEFGSFRTYYKSLADMVKLVDHAAARFKKVSCPTLLMYSLDDTLASMNNASRCYLELGTQNKALFMMNGCDHVMTLDLQRHLVHKMVGKFVDNFSSANPETTSVRSLISPVLNEARFAKGGTVTTTISPEMHGLTKDEWQELYPGKRYAHMAPVSDVDQLHSIVIRDRAQTVLNLPIFIGEYEQSANAPIKPVIASLTRMLLGRNSTVLGVGSLNQEVPGLGINEAAAPEAASYASAALNRILASLAASARVNAFSCVQENIPQLASPSVMLRASDNSPIPLHQGIDKILSGAEFIQHRSPIANWLTRFVQVALPKTAAVRSENLILEEAAVG